MCPMPGDRDLHPPALVARSLPRGAASRDRIPWGRWEISLIPKSSAPSQSQAGARNLRAQAGAFPVLPDTLGLGQPRGQKGWQQLQSPLGGAQNPQSSPGDAPKPQGLQEEVRDQRGRGRKSTHTRLCIPPSLIELINLAKMQRSVICLIQ